MSFASDHSVTGLEAAKKAVGGPHKLARALGITPVALWRWNNVVPLKRLLEVEKVSGVPRWLLRPDLFTAPAKPTKRTRKAA